MDDSKGPQPDAVQPSPDAGKRKAEETPSRGSPKQAKKDAALVQLKGSRLSLKQKAVGWDRTMPVLRAVLDFQSFLAQRATEALQEVPEQHLSLIASLTQESDKNETDLAKSIRATLMPEGSEVTNTEGNKVDVLSLSTIQASLQRIAQRVNYGVEAGPEEEGVPTIWRWEVHDFGLLPKENLDKLLARREERVQAKEQVKEILEGMPLEKYQTLFQSKKKTNAKPSSQDDRNTQLERKSSPPTDSVPVQTEDASKPVTPVPKEKSERTKLRESRRAERQAKEEKEEKDKQAQVRLFNSFFQQPVVKSSSKKEDEDQKTDFEKTFLPCEFKNMAEPNKFYRPVDDSLLKELDARTRPSSDLLSEFKHRYGRPKMARPRGICPPVNVREIMKAVTESDVLGGNAEEQAKRGLEKLNNRQLLPIKLLQFQSDRRPGWIGTFTRSSKFITPRKPLGQDPLVLDYSYDSDAEWEDVEEGENVDPLDEREDEESVAGSEEDSEMDDWLEDDLEEEEEAMPLNESTASLDTPASVSSSRSALVSSAPAGVNTLKPKKKLKLLGRRFDSKLVPYSTGPHWEAKLAEPSHESFAPYRIQFLNEAYLGLDPFSFLAQSPSGEHFAPSIKGVSKTAIEAKLNECAARESKKPGAKWIIKDEWKQLLGKMAEWSKAQRLEKSVSELRESSTRSSADWRSLEEHISVMKNMEDEKFDLARRINEQEATLSMLESEIEELRRKSDMLENWDVEEEVVMDKNAKQPDALMRQFFIFDQPKLHAIVKGAIANHGNNTELIFDEIVTQLRKDPKVGPTLNPNSFRDPNEWVFNNAGGAMGSMYIIHASITEADDYFHILYGEQRAYKAGALVDEVRTR
ncbi:hypothetical protein MCAP1_002283 [Malassezia caprae]|uniref:Chromatin assembly factor 1 subunit A dimerization domain-containing protein n=1 Tax=Malassezia caprae TaxID=1381934 RepID=A0AAF0E818_9BASI|nr:hypothetical protein MCAP1_002283 [Malassezia caprae]